jgi:hypothetical protein
MEETRRYMVDSEPLFPFRKGKGHSYSRNGRGWSLPRLHERVRAKGPSEPIR